MKNFLGGGAEFIREEVKRVPDRKKRPREGAWFAEQQVLRLTVPGMERDYGVRHLGAGEVGKMRSSRTAHAVSAALPSRVPAAPGPTAAAQEACADRTEESSCEDPVGTGC